MSISSPMVSEVDEFIKQIKDFQEHLDLALKITEDERIKAFIEHAADEEASRVKKLEALKTQLQSGNGESVRTPAPCTPAIEPDGHYKLRDHNELTVGALLGQVQ